MNSAQVNAQSSNDSACTTTRCTQQHLLLPNHLKALQIPKCLSSLKGKWAGSGKNASALAQTQTHILATVKQKDVDWLALRHTLLIEIGSINHMEPVEHSAASDGHRLESDDTEQAISPCADDVQKAKSNLPLNRCLSTVPWKYDFVAYCIRGHLMLRQGWRYTAVSRKQAPGWHRREQKWQQVA